LAQGTIQFYAATSGTNEVPPNNDPTIARTTFNLDGDVLSFLLYVPAETFLARSAAIQGPALPGSNAPIIFDLGLAGFNGGSPQFCIPATYIFGSPFTGVFGAGPFTLTDSQIYDLKNGFWYLNVTSTPYPEGQIRGQILEVPQMSASYTNNRLQYGVTGATGTSCIIQASTNAVDWVSIQTNTSPFTFTDTSAINYPYRFYRAKVDVPPPWAGCPPFN
jgi:hypothetical protein